MEPSIDGRKYTLLSIYTLLNIVVIFLDVILEKCSPSLILDLSFNFSIKVF